MTIFKEIGIKRVYWVHLGGARCEMFWKGLGSTESSRNTIASLDGMLINAAVRAARIPEIEIEDRPGVPGEIRCRFVLETLEGATELEMWRRDATKLPRLEKLVAAIGEWIEGRTGIKAVLR